MDEELDALDFPEVQGASAIELAEFTAIVEAELQSQEAARLSQEGQAEAQLEPWSTCRPYACLIETQPWQGSSSEAAVPQPAYRSLSAEPICSSLSAADEHTATKADTVAEVVYALLEQADENLEYGALWAVGGIFCVVSAVSAWVSAVNAARSRAPPTAWNGHR